MPSDLETFYIHLEKHLRDKIIASDLEETFYIHLEKRLRDVRLIKCLREMVHDRINWRGFMSIKIVFLFFYFFPPSLSVRNKLDNSFVLNRIKTKQNILKLSESKFSLRWL